MVRPKDRPVESLREILEQLDRDNPVVATRYFVSEVTPAYRYDDEYDFHWVRATSTKVSPFYETPEEAKQWLDRHEPDKGKTLEVRKQEKRRMVREVWGSDSRV